MKLTSRLACTAVIGAATLSVACQPEAGNANETPEEEAAVATPAMDVSADVAEPDTTGAAIWAHLQEANYDEEWELWPDKGRLYPGQQPHGAQLTTLLNGVAYEALMSDAERFPDGSIVVKQNFTPDGDLAAVTTMYKAAGYNDEHNDWFFSKHLPDGELDQAPNGMALEGRLPGCQGCHIAKQDNDYIYTGELGN